MLEAIRGGKRMRRVKVALRHDDDAGFGLVEAIVALLIAGVVFSALAATLISAIQASLYGRQNQQATDFMTREIEQLRSLDFGSLAHASAPSGGPLVSCATTVCLPVDGIPEPVVVDLGGAVQNSRVLTGAETNATAYTLNTYITEAVGQPDDQVRRATVVISWMNRGSERTRSVSTLIAYSQRGLPLPVFRLEVIDSPQSVNPGGTVMYELIVTNQGAPDRFNLTIAGAGTGWQWFADTNADGDYGSGVDVALTDTSSDGVPDTGRMDPSTTFRFFLIRTVPTSEAVGTKVATVTASSVGQPAAVGGVKSVDVVTVVTTGAVVPPGPTVAPPTPVPTCAFAGSVPAVGSPPGGYTTRQLTLQHEGIGDSNLQPQMYLGFGQPDEPVLGIYSKDVDPAATGRVLAKVPSINADTNSVLTSTNPARYADWARQFAKAGNISGSGVVRLWVDGGGTPVDVKVVLYRTTGTALSSRQSLAERTVAVPPCAGFQEFYVQLPSVTASIGKNQWMGIRLVAVGSDTVRLAYDEPWKFPATFTIHTKGNF
jgi:type II secretory pathway pseudopilin PulG